jgi:regulator of ribosome biosynthesis
VVDRVSQAVMADLDNGVDPFLKRAQEKKERVEVNKKQNQANHRRAMKESMGTMGSSVHELSLNKDFKEKSKTQLEAAYDVARTSTASVGKFDEKTKNEPKMRGGKRKFDAVVEERPKAGSKNADGTSSKNEQQKNLALLSRMLGAEGGGDTVLNQTKAVKSVHDQVGQQMALDEREMKRAKKIFKKKERGTSKKSKAKAKRKG